MKRLHTPSVLIGALLGLCVVLSMGGTDDGGARYQISASGSGGEGGNHMVYIVDTETGHLWSRSHGGRSFTDYGTATRPTAVFTKVPPVRP